MSSKLNASRLQKSKHPMVVITHPNGTEDEYDSTQAYLDNRKITSAQQKVK